MGPLKEYKFTLPGRSVMLNELLRLHWAKRRRLMGKMAWQIVCVVPQRPVKPLQKATVHVLRHSLKLPDTDNLCGTMKLLLDCLVKSSKTHPYGLGFIVDDDPVHVTTSIESVRCGKLVEQRLEVVIREVK